MYNWLYHIMCDDLHSRLYLITYKYELEMNYEDFELQEALSSADKTYKFIAVEFGTVVNLSDNHFRYARMWGGPGEGRGRVL